MSRTASLLMAVLLVIGGVSVVPLAAAQSGSSVASIGGSTDAQVDENASATAENVTSGERLSAVVGVMEAELEGEVEQRAYGIAYTQASTADAKAQVVGERLAAIEQRLADLEAQRDELVEAREDGELGDGEFQARMTELAARTETVEQLADASEARAGELPNETLEANGINVSAIQMLKTNAENLTGPEVAAIAQSIAGPDVGRSVSDAAPADVGIPDEARDRGGDDADAGDRSGDGGDMTDAESALAEAGRQIDAVEDQLNETEERVNQSGGDENATDAIAAARDELDDARDALTEANAAMDAGNADDAAALAEAALSHAQAAEEHLQDALAALQNGSDGSDTSGTSDSGAGDDAGTSGGDY